MQIKLHSISPVFLLYLYCITFIPFVYKNTSWEFTVSSQVYNYLTSKSPDLKHLIVTRLHDHVFIVFGTILLFSQWDVLTSFQCSSNEVVSLTRRYAYNIVHYTYDYVLRVTTYDYVVCETESIHEWILLVRVTKCLILVN